MVGDENFSANGLPAAAQSWHSTLLTETTDISAIFPSATYDEIEAGNIDPVAEELGFNVVALLNAFRVTKNLAILDKADELMQVARSSLADKDGDGWLEWVRLDPDPPDLYMTDFHMARSTLSGLVNQYAYVMDLNRSKLSPSGIDYNERANFWIDFFDNHFYPDNGWQVDNLRHRNIAGMRGLYYYWKRTRDVATYILLAKYRNYFLQSPQLILQNGRYLWDHNTPWDGQNNVTGWQATNYAQYTLASIMDLALEGVEPFRSDIDKYAATAEAILAGGINVIQNTVECVGSGNFAASKLTTWALLGAGRWRPSLRELGDDVMAITTLPNAIVPAWMVVATT